MKELVKVMKYPYPQWDENMLLTWLKEVGFDTSMEILREEDPKTGDLTFRQKIEDGVKH